MMYCPKESLINKIVTLLRRMPSKYDIQWQKLQANAEGGPRQPHELDNQTVKSFYRSLSFIYLN